MNLALNSGSVVLFAKEKAPNQTRLPTAHVRPDATTDTSCHLPSKNERRKGGEDGEGGPRSSSRPSDPAAVRPNSVMRTQDVGGQGRRSGRAVRPRPWAVGKGWQRRKGEGGRGKDGQVA